MKKKVIIIGGGLAGIESAYQIAKRGIEVDLFEMRPTKMTEAHQTKYLGEMICSNSLGSNEISTASGLLKEELKMMGSFFLRLAEKNRVPSGQSLAVDRIELAKNITEEISSFPNINIINEEIKNIPQSDSPIIIASGPLTSSTLAQSLTNITKRKNLFFYDATCPIINAESIKQEKLFFASRYDKGNADFLNIPLTQQEYHNFVNDLIKAEKVDIKNFEKNIFFEACLPIEEIARRDEKTLSFGPLKPVGLLDPKTRKRPFAVVQLRQDDFNKKFYQMVGFQTRLKQGEQKKIFRKLPGLEKAEFERYGRIHKNTYINAPLILNKFYQSRYKETISFAGQISGVEGYLESVNSGLVAGIFTAKKILKETLHALPENSASGALLLYITEANWKDFKPMKFTFGLLPDNGIRIKNKLLKKQLKAKKAIESLAQWIKKENI